MHVQGGVGQEKRFLLKIVLFLMLMGFVHF